MFSLQGSVKTCSVNDGLAANLQSQRILNSTNMVCPLFKGTDDVGRPVCPDSYNLSAAGCQNPLNRVSVENFQRPKYFNYVTLDSAGVNSGGLYADRKYNSDFINAKNKEQLDYSANNHAGNFGLDYGAHLRYDNCGVNAYSRAMQQVAEQNRQDQVVHEAYQQYETRNSCGL